ncbi:hypothetical protein BJ138DRAFT_1197527 [Hygrophoropsis aurantiaca]|uniref:Uncharacterized protein n=1 Tax=Hygrophoropsis aurantiaca TaxID=72124 RepID=A0ACB8A8Q9_9AGAM|nr:hypothetical protein BJ138DRAFT_1197527 [Hygrophoropsis aurantiaca]
MRDSISQNIPVWVFEASPQLNAEHCIARYRLLNEIGQVLGAALRDFQKTVCPAFNTRELKREADARNRRSNTQSNQRRKQPKIDLAARNSAAAASGLPAADGTHAARRPKTLNLQTYKLHALGDYADCIRRYGTTDSYSTEPGELEHRTPKRWYTRTSRKQYVGQITRIERRQTRIRRIRERLGNRTGGSSETHADEDSAMACPSGVHHVIGSSQNIPCDIPSFVQKYTGDPAIQEFVPRLKKHLLPRIRAQLQSEMSELGGPPTCDEHAEVLSGDDYRFVFFKNERIYEHKLMRINCTTYDVRRAQDVVNPSTSHNNIMVLASAVASDGSEGYSNHHPFLYARIIGIFHANVIYTGPGTPDYSPRRLEFLWVRWYKIIEHPAAGWDACKLDRVCFHPMASEDAFGFLDPNDVLRSCHLIPAFAFGKVHADGTGLSRCIDDSQDWRSYYVNRFVDRDMVMRYHIGLGVGHVHTIPDHDHLSANGNSLSADREHEPEEAVNNSSNPHEEGELEGAEGPGDSKLADDDSGAESDGLSNGSEGTYERSDDDVDVESAPEEYSSSEGDLQDELILDMYGIDDLDAGSYD